ncbi:MAG: hydroxymethylglutaryl-CoA reductase [Patescibacteria group bacterium]|nr:hydroxymethylglutaryl-CoA reductase [Patescibacteria group bacterium]
MLKGTKLKDYPHAQKRRLFLEKTLGINLSGLGEFSFAEDAVRNKNIENLVGATQIPMGVAGPILVNGQFARGEFYLPLATTEGALVASVSRGCKAISRSGGVTVLVENVGTTRAPVFQTKGISESKKLIKWVENNFSALQKVAENSSSHLKLLNFKPYFMGRNVWLRLNFDTADAMGMNMATTAATLIIRIIEVKTGCKCVSVSGNLDVDKKPSWINFLEGRGKKVWAEAVISREIAQEVLKTTPDKMVETSRAKVLYGSILSGSLGFNSHFANIIAALFAATGQDLAHITEGSLGVTTTEISDKDLYISIYLPDLMIGTVGGGTGLPAQKEALSLLKIPDPSLKSGQQVLKLAEIIGSAVLAGELSLLGALAAGQLASAHEKLGRGRMHTDISGLKADVNR